MRMLQPVEHGGYAAHPVDFAEAVMEVAKGCGSSGWVCGVGGVHPWEMALMDARLQKEVWGEDQDTWIASPYMPSGVATPVEGGWRLTGRWQFSSGTDHCDWIFLGAFMGVGVSAALGVGGRDLSAAVGGLSTRTALARLGAALEEAGLCR